MPCGIGNALLRVAGARTYCTIPVHMYVHQKTYIREIHILSYLYVQYYFLYVHTYMYEENHSFSTTPRMTAFIVVQIPPTLSATLPDLTGMVWYTVNVITSHQPSSTTPRHTADRTTMSSSSKADNQQDDKGKKDDLSSESSASDDDDDSLVLEGQLVRNPDVSASSSSGDSDNESDNDREETQDEHDHDRDEDQKEERVDQVKPETAQTTTTVAAAKRKQPDDKADNKHNNNKKKKRKSKNRPHDASSTVDMSYVEFIFCDMDEKYWDGIRALLSNGASLYAAHASALADAMIEYDMVGTVLAQEDDTEHNVYGFASLLHWGHVPDTAQAQFKAVLGRRQDDVNDACQKRVVRALQDTDKKSPATAFLLTGRMINVPLEIVLALHQQVWQDIVWAQGEQTKLSYKRVQTLLRLAPCTRDKDASYVYRYYDDELLAQQAVGSSYVVEAPRSFSREDVVYLHVLELTLPAYQRAIQSLEQMVNNG